MSAKNAYFFDTLAGQLRLDSEKGIPRPSCEADFSWWEKVWFRKDDIDLSYIRVHTPESLTAYRQELKKWREYADDVLSVYHAPGGQHD